MSEEPQPVMSGSPLLRRFLLLLAALAVGSVVGWLGYRYTADPVWWLAIIGAVALVWLFVADPTQCCPVEPPRPPRKRSQ